VIKFLLAHPYSVIMVVMALAGLVAIYRALLSPELRYHSCAYKLKAKLFFWVGDIRRLHAFPWVTWAPHHCTSIDMQDVLTASSLCRPGDIGLHRDSGYLSNCSIPGSFKHAWICVEDDDIVEAISDGVIRRHNTYPLLSDFAIILRPMGASGEDCYVASKRANDLVGSEYDANFLFDFAGDEKKYSENITGGKFHGAFSCTETVAFSWYHLRNKLGIFRSRHAGREAIIADDYLRMNFEIVWASPSVTVEWAMESGLHEQGRTKIAEYWERLR
jgi:hypothetical protein